MSIPRLLQSSASLILLAATAFLLADAVIVFSVGPADRQLSHSPQ